VTILVTPHISAQVGTGVGGFVGVAVAVGVAGGFVGVAVAVGVAGGFVGVAVAVGVAGGFVGVAVAVGVGGPTPANAGIASPSDTPITIKLQRNFAKRFVTVISPICCAARGFDQLNRQQPTHALVSEPRNGTLLGEVPKTEVNAPDEKGAERCAVRSNHPSTLKIQRREPPSWRFALIPRVG
jgi:hypothetical protein